MSRGEQYSVLRYGCEESYQVVVIHREVISFLVLVKILLQGFDGAVDVSSVEVVGIS